MNSLIGVIDYGAGNIGSIIKMIETIGARSIVVAEPAQLDLPDRLILPGVGHYDHGVSQLHARGLFSKLSKIDARQQPLLGICLGMQLLMESSEEGALPGLGLIGGSCRRFPANDGSQKIPHMGWNTVLPTESHQALSRQSEDSRYYFVHSFYVEPDDPGVCVGTTEHIVPFCSAIDTGGGITGYQFHPEKSHRFGKDLLRRFVAPC